MSYINVEKGYFTPAQSDLNWAQTFRMTGRAPGFANRIFDTKAHMELYINDVSQKASATPGLLLVVISDTADNNGVYRVLTVKETAEGSAGTYEKVGDPMLRVSNYSTDLASMVTSGSWLLKNTSTNEGRVLTVCIENGNPVQYLFSATSYQTRTYSSSTWSDWSTAKSYETTDNKSQSIDESETHYPSCKAVFEELKNKCDVDGVYPNLTAGNLLGQETDTILSTSNGFIFRTTGGDESIGSGNAKMQKIVGSRLDQNGCIPFAATHMKSVQYNAFDKDTNVILRAKIENDRTINRSAAAGNYIAFVKVVKGELGGNNGYVVAFKDGTQGTLGKIGYTTEDPNEAETVTILNPVVIKEQDCYLTPSIAYLMISTNNIEDLYVHLKWSYEASRDAGYARYKESVIPLPRAHSWGTASIADKQEIIDFAAKIIYRKFDRVLLSSLGAWIESISYGEYAYTDSDRTQSAGAIEAYSSSSITIGDVVYARYSDGDTGTSLVWKDVDDNVVYTTKVVTYTSTNAISGAKASTTYLATPTITGLTPSIDSSCKVVLDAHGVEVTSEEVANRVYGKYIYYELATSTQTTLTTADYYELEPETEGKIILDYDVNDFGTEEFLFGENIPVTAWELSILYLINMKDGLRALLMKQSYVTYTVDFGRYGLEAHSKNMVGDTNIQLMSMYNVASLKLNVSGTEYNVNVSLGSYNISVSYQSTLTWQITKTDPNLPACIGVRELVINEV